MYVFGAHFLWVFTAIALIGVLLYVYAFTGSAATDVVGEVKALLSPLILVPTIG